MGTGQQTRLDRLKHLANEFFQFSKEKKELEGISTHDYEQDISYCEWVMTEALEEIEELDPPVGTDAYRILWESRGQRRIDDAIR